MAPGPIDRTKDLTFTWTNGGNGLHLVNISATVDANTSVIVQCRFAGAAGTGVVPSAALMKVPAGMQLISSQLTSNKTTMAGDYCIELSLGQSNATAGGQQYGGKFTFQ